MRSLLGQCHFPTVLCLQAVNLLRIVIVYVVSIVVSVCFHHHHLITSNFGGNFSKALSRGCSSARGVCLCRRHTYMGIIERYTVVAQNSDVTSCLKMTPKKSHLDGKMMLPSFVLVRAQVLQGVSKISYQDSWAQLGQSIRSFNLTELRSCWSIR